MKAPRCWCGCRGKTLTTVIVNGANLCVYRSTEMAGEAPLLDPQAMLDEVFPAIAYYQDTWGGIAGPCLPCGIWRARGEFSPGALSRIEVPDRCAGASPKAHCAWNPARRT